MTPTRYVLVGIAAALLFGIGVLVGHSYGADQQVKRRLTKDLALQARLMGLEQGLLASATVQPPTVTSGEYVLEQRLADGTQKTTAVKLEFSEGRLTHLDGLPIRALAQAGPVVSWEQIDPEEGPSAQFVGLVDGARLWGRLYVGPGQGWHEGEPPVSGVWTLQRPTPQ